MSIQGKFRLLLVLLGVSTVVNVGISVWCIRVYVDRAIESFDEQLKAVRESIMLRSQLSDELVSELEERKNQPLEDRDLRYKLLCRAIDEGIHRIIALDDQIPARLKGLSSRLAAGCDDYVRLVDSGQLSAAEQLMQNDLKPNYIRPMYIMLTELSAGRERGNSEAAADLSQTQTKVTALLAVNALATFLLAFAGIQLARNWILQPIGALKAAAEQHARGNLHYRVPVSSGDEFGALSREVNRMADSLLDIQKRLVQKERMAAMGEVVSTVAHNIRNPLAGIRASAQSAMHELPEASVAHQQQMRIIETVDSLSRWLKELLMVNKPLELDRRRVRVREIVAGVTAVQQSNAERRRLTFAYQESAPDLEVIADPRYLEQAILVVVDNAMDASPCDSVIDIGARQADGAIILTVADRGGGIPQAIRDRIASAYSSTKPGGTGIGLYLAKKTVEAHGGSINFAERDGGGTVVSLIMPMDAQEESALLGPMGRPESRLIDHGPNSDTG